eukprot:scaffold99667_cov36-Phaeocystis_antarctica.AAC.1
MGETACSSRDPSHGLRIQVWQALAGSQSKTVPDPWQTVPDRGRSCKNLATLPMPVRRWHDG